MRYPLVVKPADASGCRGVGSAEHPAELPAAIEAAREHSFELQPAPWRPRGAARPGRGTPRGVAPIASAER